MDFKFSKVAVVAEYFSPPAIKFPPDKESKF